MTRSERGIPKHEPLFDVDPVTGATIEVFYADRSLVGWTTAISIGLLKPAA